MSTVDLTSTGDQQGEGKTYVFGDFMRTAGISDALDCVDSIMSLDGYEPPIPTGFPMFDEALGGGLKNGLYILGAIPSMGKTTFATQIADNISLQGKPVLFVTIEQSRAEIAAKPYSRILATRNWRWSAGAILDPSKRDKTLQGALEEAQAEFGKGGRATRYFIMEPKRQPTINDVRQAVIAVREQYDTPPVLFIDYLQLLAYDDACSDKQGVDRSVMGLRQLARDERMPIFAISNLNRNSYSQSISIDAFKESGAIEYGADVLLGLQPAHMGESLESVSEGKMKRAAGAAVDKYKSSPVREGEILVLKNRSGRVAVGDDAIQFRFDPVTCTFKESGAKRASYVL